MSRWRGKIVDPKTQEQRAELDGKKVKCIKKKWGNITLDKVYTIMYRHGHCVVYDDDFDYYGLEKNDIGTLFEIVEEINMTYVMSLFKKLNLPFDHLEEIKTQEDVYKLEQMLKEKEEV